MSYSTFGERLKSAREHAGLLQSQVAEMCNLKSATVVSNWEKNYNQPDLNKLLSLCEVLQVSPNYLVGYAPPDSLSSTDLSQSELELVKRMRLLDERGTATVLQTLQMQEDFVSSYNNDRRDFAVAESLDLPSSVFLAASDSKYNTMKKRARDLKPLKKNSYRSFEDITKFLWDLGYGDRICLAYVIQVFNGTKVPCQLLYQHISSYLTHQVRYSFVDQIE